VRMTKLGIIGVALWVAASSSGLAAPVSTAFTYQGQLKQDGLPTTDVCDFQFTLWNAVSAGTPIGSPYPLDDVHVANGLFAVELDFGADAFGSNQPWLEVGVRCPAGAGSFTTLNPRQPITAVPYAIQTRGITVADNGNVGIGTTTPGQKLHVAGEGNTRIRVESSDVANQAAVLELFGSGTDLAYLYYGLTAARGRWLHMEVPSGKGGISLDTNGSNPRLAITQDGNVGIGTTTPWTKVNVYGDASPNQVYREDPVLLLTKASGTRVNGEGPSLGFNSGGEFLYGAIKGAATNSQSGQFGGYLSFYTTAASSFHAERIRIDESGNVGIGTTTPPQQLSLTGGVGFANQNAADKKLYSPSDGTLEWMTNDSAGTHAFVVSHQGVQRVSLNTSGNSFLNGGNVGIGTASPDSKLTVAGEVHVTSGGIRFPNGTVQTTAPTTNGISSINSQTGPAITLAAGTGVNINQANNTITLSATAVPGGITSINGENGPSITIAVGPGLSISHSNDQITISNSVVGLVAHCEVCSQILSPAQVCAAACQGSQYVVSASVGCGPCSAATDSGAHCESSGSGICCVCKPH
jgi:hypothetical protein